jgi:phage virion morphogenesis protein
VPVETTININDKAVNALLTKVSRRMDNTKPAFEIIGDIVLSSIQRNFEEGGRPDKWAQLAQATIDKRIETRRWPGQILISLGAGGGLLGSIFFQAFTDKVVLAANKIYAAIHHFGGQAGRNKSVTIPKRPYMLVQDEDWEEIKEALTDYLTG